MHCKINDGAFGPSSDPEYNAELNETFSIVGGTGRFEGATGGGLVHGFLKAGGFVVHIWTGNITLVK